MITTKVAMIFVFITIIAFMAAVYMNDLRFMITFGVLGILLILAIIGRQIFK